MTTHWLTSMTARRSYRMPMAPASKRLSAFSRPYREAPNQDAGHLVRPVTQRCTRCTKGEFHTMAQIITRQEAMAQGLSHYFTGKPCVRGHIAASHKAQSVRGMYCSITTKQSPSGSRHRANTIMGSLASTVTRPSSRPVAHALSAMQTGSQQKRWART